MEERPFISIVLPAYNEEDAIGMVLEEFRDVLKSLNVSYEIVVVDNNSTDKTAEVAERYGAKVAKEIKQGYGYACIRGLREAKGKIVVLSEADNSFVAKDLKKLLAYVEEDDVDMVLGTRTTLELVEKDAKMGWLLHWGNVFLAKLIQVQFWGRCRLTDVGCTFRAIKREALQKIIHNLRVGGPAFSPEMIIWCLKKGLRVIEIPVRYRRRIGESKITADIRKSIKVGLMMLKLIITQGFWRD